MWKWLWISLTLVGCQGAPEVKPIEPIVRARIELRANSEGQITVQAAARPLDAQFELDYGQTVIPPIRNAMLYFGKIAIAKLQDGNIRDCNGHDCTRAFIRMYTTGTPGAGVWNSVGGYGMPIYAGRTGDPMLPVGLNVAGAAIVQTYTLPPKKNSLSLADFPDAAYEMRADFTEAGAGTYATTLVVEYGLE